MLKECLDVFKQQLDKDGDKLIIDSYIPADGTYVLVESNDDTFKITEVENFKLNRENPFDDGNVTKKKLREFDYNSKLIDMNKPIDGKKIIHSNNYLAFFIKKESLSNGKLTNEIIDNYYNILANPYIKYTKPKAKKIYESVEEEIGSVDVQILESIRNWIKDNIFELGIEIKGKDYLKLFFDFPREEYRREGKRYSIPNIYNSNDFNIVVSEEILGLPNDNMGLNSKKPYLENKTRKVRVPYLIDSEEVLLQRKLFDYLMNLSSVGLNNVYIGDTVIACKNGDTIDKDFSGNYLRIQKGKELEIHDYDCVPYYSKELPNTLIVKNIVGINLDSFETSIPYDMEIKTRKKMQQVIDEGMFSKYLINNYFTEAKDMKFKDSSLKKNLLITRDCLFNWFYKGIDNGVYGVLNKVSLDMVKGSIENGYTTKASHQFNIRWALNNYFKGGIDMETSVNDVKGILREKINSNNTGIIESDIEYYFAVGQLVNYFIGMNKGKKKPHSLANPFINARNNEVIKEKLRVLYKKYNYEIESYWKRFNNLYAMILSYDIDQKVDQDMILAGYLHSNLVTEKNKEED
ncbi:MAG: type I-B CRISPR-associated protein Cas8b/Csh1 [Clostridium sp.]